MLTIDDDDDDDDDDVTMATILIIFCFLILGALWGACKLGPGGRSSYC